VTALFDRLQGALGDTYALERELGGGGMSRVFLATEVALGRKVVIKLLAPELTSEVMTARFKREFEVTALLQHPHILPVLAAGAREGLLYYVTPFVEGESLRHRIKREGRLPVGDVARVLSELTSALAYAHARGVVHRDIKPENVLLSGGHAVLADFGIAAALSGPRSGERLTEVGTAVGTPGYMSPEQAAGETNLDGRSDIYSLAIVGYEMLSGNPPFVGPTPLAVMTAHLTETPKPVETVRADTPPGLAAALTRALAKEPVGRFQNATDFEQALGISFTGHAPAVKAPRRRWPIAIAAALLIGAVGGVFALQRARANPALDQNLVAVAPFEVLAPGLEVWKEGLVDVVSTNLDGAGPIRTVAPAVIVRRWTGRADKQSANALGHRTGAKTAVFGRLLASGRDSVRLTATILDVASGRTLDDVEYRDESARMDRVADSLAIRVLRALNQTRAIGLVQRAPIGSSSFVAIKAFLQGEQHYRRSDWDSATIYYERAIEADSSFAPALRHLSNALGWKTGPVGELRHDGYVYAIRAGNLNRGLTPRESLLVTADSLFASLTTSAANTPVATRLPMARRLLTTLETASARFPDDPEVWYKLGDARFHFWFFFPSKENLSTTRAAFDRSIGLDSAFAPAFIHPIDIATRQQDVDGARSYIKAYLALEPGDVHATSMRLLDGLLTRRTPSVDSLTTLFRSTPGQAVSTAFGSLLFLADSNEAQVHIADALVKLSEGAPAGQGALARRSHDALVTALASRGHLRRALSHADSNTTWLYSEAALFGVIPADSAQALFSRWVSRPIKGDRDLSFVLGGVQWWTDRGDTASLKRVLTAVEGLPFKLPANAVRGLLTLARRDTAGAVRMLTMPDSVCLTNCTSVRLVLAQVLSAQKRDREAAAILDQEFAQPTASRVIWMLERGRVNERIGARAKAIDSYAFVANAFQAGDPEVQDAVKEAKGALRRLSTDPGRG
jgi:eukaryotic-like serine/threonine-protein kinase